MRIRFPALRTRALPARLAHSRVRDPDMLDVTAGALIGENEAPCGKRSRKPADTAECRDDQLYHPSANIPAPRSPSCSERQENCRWNCLSGSGGGDSASEAGGAVEVSLPASVANCPEQKKAKRVGQCSSVPARPCPRENGELSPPPYIAPWWHTYTAWFRH